MLGCVCCATKNPNDIAKTTIGSCCLENGPPASRMASAPQTKITSMIVMCYAQRNNVITKQHAEVLRYQWERFRIFEQVPLVRDFQSLSRTHVCCPRCETRLPQRRLQTPPLLLYPPALGFDRCSSCATSAPELRAPSSPSRLKILRGRDGRRTGKTLMRNQRNVSLWLCIKGR